MTAAQINGDAASHPLPDLAELDERQIRGSACVWCRVSLHAATAVNLGPLPFTSLDHTANWYPRACPQCAQASEGSS